MNRLEIELSFSKLVMEITQIGEDKLIAIFGGDNPHIGSAVLSVPRASLTGDGHISATSSVLNVTGHKDDEICRMIAERIASRENCRVVCTGGFHVDNITPFQIKELMDKIKDAL